MTGLALVYAAIFAAGVVASQIAVYIITSYKEVEQETGDLDPAVDRVVMLVAKALGLVVAAFVGGVIGSEIDATTVKLGAVAGGCGGIVGPQMWPKLKKALTALARRKVGGADKGDDQ